MRGESGVGESGPATPDPFGAFIQTTPTPFAPAPVRATSSAFQHQEQQQRSSATAPSPPHPYGPWWPAMASWCAMHSPYTGDSTNAPGMLPQAGEKWVPVPVPVPVPVLAPMPFSLHGAAPGTLSWGGGASSQSPAAFPTANAADQTRSSNGAPSLAQRHDTVALTEHDDKETRAQAAAAAGSLDEATEARDEPAEGERSPPQAEKEAAGDEKEGDGKEAAEVASQSASLVTTSATDPTRAASEAAGGSKFLAALITRLEAHETDVSERLEQQYQRTTTQLTAIEKDMRFRLQHLAEAERKEQAAAAERQAALLEAVAALRETPVRSAAEAMSEDMLSQLLSLIEMGMKRVHAALEKDELGETTSRSAATDKGGSASASAATAPTTTTTLTSERDMVKEANQRLKQLGW